MNNLQYEKSPYLLQHKNNPVNWYAWSDEAFQKAELEDKPIFLSIGYSTCHWCHVMERESFEDEGVAEILNKYFVSIKLDREERPDIDHIYMEACQAMTGSGGWPLTIVMDYEKRPFFAGTYFPKQSIKSILMQINKMWEEKRDKLKTASDQFDYVLNYRQSAPSRITDELTHEAFFLSRRIFDMNNAGFGRAPKFPSPHILLFLLAFSQHDGENIALEMVEKTLDAMYKGGIYDHIGHGFSRYSTDSSWLVPHFEKMLYDNALLSYTYIKAYSASNNEKYAEIGCKTLDYIRRVLEAPDGGFYSAEDADSEGVEGKFYVWSADEIENILGNDAKEFAMLYNITKEGNFEGKNIPNLIGKDFPYDKKQWAENCIAKLFCEREKRVHPFLDDKILVSWNGLAVSAFAQAGHVLKREDYISSAKKAVDFIEKNLRGENGRLLSRYRDNEAKFIAHAEDYAFYIWGLIELHSATHNIKYLTRALELTDVFVEDFWDDEKGGFYFSSKKSEKLISRPKPVYDGAMPSANSVSAMNMLRLSILTGDQKFEEYANRIFDAFSGDLTESPSSYTFMMYALVYKRSDVTKLVVKADKICDTKEILSVVPANAEVVIYTDKETIPAYSDNYQMQNNAVTAFLCKGHMCYPPVTSAGELSRQLAD